MSYNSVTVNVNYSLYDCYLHKMFEMALYSSQNFCQIEFN